MTFEGGRVWIIVTRRLRCARFLTAPAAAWTAGQKYPKFLREREEEERLKMKEDR